MLARLWLEKIQGEADAKTEHHFSAHTLRTKTTHRNFSALKTPKRRTSPPFDLLVTTTKRHNKMEGKPSSCPSTKCSCNTNRKTQTKPAQLTGACRSTDRHKKNPNQPRLLSTSYNSWHDMSGATWQLKATFATS